MTAKKKPAPKRRAAPKKKVTKPKFSIALTDRMKEQGYTGKWRWLSRKCSVCGGRLATDGDTTWCIGDISWKWDHPIMTLY